MRNLQIEKNVTNHTCIFDKYLREISRYDLLTPEEEVELALKIKAGDNKALEKLINSNLRFVVSVAKQYQHQKVELLDLINEGNKGLIKAAQLFDESKGFKFISYAVWWIRQSILQYLADHQKIVRLPINKIGSLNQIAKTYIALEKELERIPDHEEISESLDLDSCKVADLIGFLDSSISLDESLSEEEDFCRLDFLVDEQNIADNLSKERSLKVDIERILCTLDEREAKILRYLFGIGCEEHTLEEIGEKMDLTRERVRQIKEKALKHLQKPKKLNVIKCYLG